MPVKSAGAILNPNHLEYLGESEKTTKRLLSPPEENDARGDRHRLRSRRKHNKNSVPKGRLPKRTSHQTKRMPSRTGKSSTKSYSKTSSSSSGPLSLTDGAAEVALDLLQSNQDLIVDDMETFMLGASRSRGKRRI